LRSSENRRVGRITAKIINTLRCVISGLRREVDDNLVFFSETLVRSYHFSLRNNPEERSFQIIYSLFYPYIAGACRLLLRRICGGNAEEICGGDGRIHERNIKSDIRKIASQFPPPPSRCTEYCGTNIEADEMDWTRSMLGGDGTVHSQF
jgi:hypothetical protein